jgi:hypothetical protein
VVGASQKFESGESIEDVESLLEEDSSSSSS